MTTTSDSTATVVQRHWAAYCRGDVAALLADYADDAVLITAMTGAVQGRAAIGAVFHSLFRDAFPVDSSRFTLELELVSGEIGFVKWAVETPVLRTRGASDTIVVRNGKIVAQTGVVEIEPLSAPSVS